MTSEPVQRPYQDIFRRTYPYTHLGRFRDLVHNLNEPPNFYKQTLNFSAGLFEPQSTVVTPAYVLPFVAEAQVPRNRVIEHTVYDRDLNPVSLANHIKAFYNGYVDHPDLPVYPHFDVSTYTHVPGQSYYMGLLLPHFGHFILEVITRIWLRLSSEQKDNVKFVFNIVGYRETKHVKQNLFSGYWQHYFHALGITAKQFVLANTPLICEELIVPQCAISIGVTRAADCFISQNAADVWQETNRILSESYTPHPEETSYGDKIYISRRKVKNPYQGRMLLNEDEVEQLFTKRGFTILYPEDLTSELQKHHILSRCHTLAAVSGSGIMNSVFMPRGSKTLSLISDLLNRGIPGLEQQIAIDHISDHKTCIYYQDDFVEDADKAAHINISALHDALDDFLRL